MRYSIESYDKYGYLKPTRWLWAGWFFLARAWIVFVVAGASRESGSKILEFVYPDQQLLYVGLATSIPTVILMWIISLRNGERRWIDKLITWAKPITLLVVAAQLLQTIHHIQIDRGAFSWPNAITLVLLAWFALFVGRSHRVKTCFTAPKID
ncbi:DUF2919 domain-containing protein [Vibrio maerlii]|uniref:DUF2919 domain-containing protein n=1 Tax=Vibrio maerlii TaxID=2231648 RepID=UPI000E3CFB3D|nr:DUF2919 domain-containing protein [Vibrio maerlii]